MEDFAKLALTSAIWAVIAACAAALIAGWLSRRTKISEFRQAWINDLREDIADYVGAARKWNRSYDDINALDPNDADKARRERDEVFPLASEALVILWRIKLRFNPHKNKYRAEDDHFLTTLDDLLNPGKIFPNRTWADIASDAISQARRILKREWEVTKGSTSKIQGGEA
ncbi:MAG: hypothetical protein HQL42_10505 [Alphaproteobacteria bacterium]|nr:hypothetical protein [Alphaproteobacteria bacterium]